MVPQDSNAWLPLSSPLLPSLFLLKFSLGTSPHQVSARAGNWYSAATCYGNEGSLLPFRFLIHSLVCTLHPVTALAKETLPPQTSKKTWLKLLLWQVAISEGRARDGGDLRLQDARVLFSAGQANNSVLNYRPRFSCGCCLVFFFIYSCLFRFISIIPDTVLSDIIIIILLLCLPGSREASRGLLQSRKVVGMGLPARCSSAAPGSLMLELGTLVKAEAQGHKPLQGDLRSH